MQSVREYPTADNPHTLQGQHSCHTLESNDAARSNEVLARTHENAMKNVRHAYQHIRKKCCSPLVGDFTFYFYRFFREQARNFLIFHLLQFSFVKRPKNWSGNFKNILFKNEKSAAVGQNRFRSRLSRFFSRFYFRPQHLPVPGTFWTISR